MTGAEDEYELLFNTTADDEAKLEPLDENDVFPSDIKGVVLRNPLRDRVFQVEFELVKHEMSWIEAMASCLASTFANRVAVDKTA
jgi:hypothetical protein